MSVLKVLKIGAEALQIRSAEVTKFSNQTLYDAITDLKDTLKDSGGVGLAASQVGINERIIIVGFEDNRRYPYEKTIPLSVLINPIYEPLSKLKIEDWEGCLSIPGLRGRVPRYNKIYYSAQDFDGNKIEGQAEGFHARIIQHEYDHLEGVNFIERMINIKSLGFEEELREKIEEEKKNKVFSQET